MWTVLLVLSITAAVTFIHRCFTFWKRSGFPEIKPSIIFGNLEPVAKGQKSFGVTIHDLYKKSEGIPFVGIYLFFRPTLLVNDLILAKCILEDDFQHFHDRGVYSSLKHDPLSGGLFQLGGRDWKALRSKLTPAFSSAKLKNMFKTFYDVGVKLERHISVKSGDGCVVEMKDLLSRYIVDIVASTIFGFEVDTIENPQHQFRDVGKSFTDPNLINRFRNAGFFLWPK